METEKEREHLTQRNSYAQIRYIHEQLITSPPSSRTNGLDTTSICSQASSRGVHRLVVESGGLVQKTR